MILPPSALVNLWHPSQRTLRCAPCKAKEVRESWSNKDGFHRVESWHSAQGVTPELANCAPWISPWHAWHGVGAALKLTLDGGICWSEALWQALHGVVKWEPSKGNEVFE